MVTVLKLIIRILVLFYRQRHKPWKPGEPIECLVVGYSGANNTGAEARTVEAVKQMLAADERLRVTISSLDRRRTLRYLTENDRLRVVGIHPVFLFSMAKLVACSHIVVLAEGCCFYESFSSLLLWYFLYASEFAERLSIPVVAYGVDAGSLSPINAAWAKEVADRMALVMMRTNAAADKLKEWGVEVPVEVTADTAFTITPKDRVWAETVLRGQGVDLVKPLLGIAFEEFFWWPVVPKPLKALLGIRRDRYKSVYYHDWGKDGLRKSERMKDAVAAYADWAAGEYGAQVIFFAMESLGAAPCRDVMERMRTSSILIDADHASAAQMTAFLRRLDWLVTCDYHALLLSMGGLVPMIGLGHDERIPSIMDELGLLDDYFISHEEDNVRALLLEKTPKLLAASDDIRKRIQFSLPAYFDRMEKNKTLFARQVDEAFKA